VVLLILNYGTFNMIDKKTGWGVRGEYNSGKEVDAGTK
jgi:hypothetical protein